MSRPFAACAAAALISAGVREFVICAGARNAALLVVLAAAGGRVRLWQHFEERSAGFFALGRIRATGAPVAVLTTSGTAVAELLPAMIEAFYQGLPLVAFTADRPRHYRNSGAPQAIEQPGIFGPYAPLSLDVAEGDTIDLSGWECDRPLHVNICLEEPDGTSLPLLREPVLPEPPASSLPTAWLEPFSNNDAHSHLLIAGELLPHESAFLRSRLKPSGGPIFAEAASGLRGDPALQSRLLRCGDASLRGLPVDRITRCGGVPSVRFWRDLENRPQLPVTSLSRSGHPGLARQEFPSNSSAPSLPASDWQARDTALYARLEELFRRYPSSEPALFRSLSTVIPAGAAVLTGNSLAVREWDLCATWRRGHQVHVLRGANGIDGNLSAFLGLAADQPESWCLTGDLTALYDLAAPWMLDQLPPGRRRFVVIQNGGGKIFSRLPSLRGLTARERSLMENPHTISLEPWARLWRMDHLHGGPELLARPSAFASLSDRAVIELHPDAAETEAFWNAWSAAEQDLHP